MGLSRNGKGIFQVPSPAFINTRRFGWRRTLDYGWTNSWGTLQVIDRTEVYKAIDSERDYQDRRWPGHTHSIPDYILFIEDYLAEARHMVSRSNNEAAALDTIRKVAALAVICMEEHGAPVRKLN